MRVTEQSRYRAMSKNISRNSERIQSTFEDVSSGRRVRVASDDPVAYAASKRLSSELARQEAYIANGESMKSYFDMAEDSLERTTDVLTRVRELAVQYSSDVYSPSQQESAAEEFASLRESIIDLANTQVGDTYIFGGTKDRTAPFNPETGDFQGTNDVRNVSVGRNSDVTQLSAATLFNGQGGGQNIIGLLDSLITAAGSGDTDTIQASLDGLDTSIEQVVQGRQRAGYELNTIEHARSFAENVVFRNKTGIGDLTEVDLPMAISEMHAAKAAFDASAAVSQQLNQIANTALNLLR